MFRLFMTVFSKLYFCRPSYEHNRYIDGDNKNNVSSNYFYSQNYNNGSVMARYYGSAHASPAGEQAVK